MAFGISAWFLMMVAVMSMAGVGMFGMGLGKMAPVMKLVLHLIFGAVSRYMYARLDKPAATADSGA